MVVNRVGFSVKKKALKKKYEYERSQIPFNNP
jgi:hypothetical protein